MKDSILKSSGSYSRYFSPVIISMVVLSLIAFFVYYIVPFFKRMKENQEAKNYIKDIERKEEVSQTENLKNSVEIQKKKVALIKRQYPKVSIKLMNNLKTYAQQIASALGTDPENYRPLFGITGLPKVHNKYTEDEETVVQILKKTIGTFPILEDLYQKVYTANRNLKTDLYEYLSKSDLNEIRKAHAKYTNEKIL